MSAEYKALCERLKDQYGDPDTGGFEYTNPDGPEAAATIKALIAELKEARGLLKEILESDKDWLVLAPDQSVRVSAFLARNGKGEG